jgi:hypothetical protein
MFLRSNTEVRFPTAIGCFGSFPKPDFASRLNVGVGINKDIPAPFRPVVLVGEAKRKTPTKDEGTKQNPSPAGAETQRLAAQLAWIVQPTLTLIIIDAVNKWEQAHPNGSEVCFLLQSHIGSVTKRRSP